MQPAPDNAGRRPPRGFCSLQPRQGRPVFLARTRMPDVSLSSRWTSFQKFRFRPHGTQLLDDTEGYAGSRPWTATPAGFVDDQNARHPRTGYRNGHPVCVFLPVRAALDWRNADDVSGSQPVCLVDPFFVDTHFSGPEDAVNAGFSERP